MHLLYNLCFYIQESYSKCDEKYVVTFNHLKFCKIIQMLQKYYTIIKDF